MIIAPCSAILKAFLLMPLIVKNLIYSASRLGTMGLVTRVETSISLECLF